MADALEQINGKNVIAAIDFHEAIIYVTDAVPGQRPERLVATDPHGRFHKVHLHSGSPSGVYEGDMPAYWRELTDVVSPAGQSCCEDTVEGKRTRRIDGLPTSKNIARMSQPS
jgi:hypothetical protein